MRPQFGFNSPADYYGLFRHLRDYFERLLGAVAPMLVEPNSVLDLACGVGDFTQMLGSKFSRSTVVGMDISSPYVAYAAKNNRSDRITYVVSPAQGLLGLPWVPGIDTVFVKGSYHLFESELPLSSFSAPQFDSLEQLIIIEKTERSLGTYPAPASAQLVMDKYVDRALARKRLDGQGVFEVRSLSYGESLSVPRSDYLAAFQARQFSYLAQVSDTELSAWIEDQASTSGPVSIFEENVANIYYRK